jgi:hypothetical protein
MACTIAVVRHGQHLPGFEGSVGAPRGIDDGVRSGRRQVVGGAGQGGRGPDEPTGWIRDDLHVDAVTAMQRE